MGGVARTSFSAQWGSNIRGWSNSPKWGSSSVSPKGKVKNGRNVAPTLDPRKLQRRLNGKRGSDRPRSRP